MDYVKALLIKLVMVTVVLWIVLGVFYGVPFGPLFILSLAITGVSFLIGDLYILPRFENWGATIVDFLLVIAAVWGFSVMYTNVNFPLLTAAGISAIIIAICEVFFHQYVDRHILRVDDRTGGRNRDQLSKEERLQTEFGEEIDPVPDKENDDT